MHQRATVSLWVFALLALVTLARSGTASAQAAPSIALSATTVMSGGTVTATMANGPGNAGDWVGLFGASAADGTYLDWKYLNGTQTQPGTGVPGAAVAFTMPATPGSYNVRFFENNSWTKLATSATITVTAAPPPTIALSATSVVAGGTVTATIANGPGTSGDWVGLHGATAADGTFVDWKYLNGTRIQPGAGVTGAAVAFTMPATPGSYNVRFFENNSWTKLATSATITVTAPPPPSLTLSATTAVPGGTVTATVANGPGNAGDWVGLFGASVPDATSYVDWKYLNGTRSTPGSGLTGAAVAFTMPAEPGTYNVRFFLNDSWTKLATSATITVTAASSGRTIGIHFVGGGTSMGAAESAGVLPTANWNNPTGASRATALALVDDTGAPSGATVTWSSNGTWQTPITDQAGNLRLMKGYLDSTETSVTTVSVAGLPNAAYDVYVYADGDNAGLARTGAYRISGTGITATTINLTDAANTNFNATFTQATNSNGNYVKFSVVASGFTLTATPGVSTGTRRAPVNAVQIVPTAPPSPDFAVSATPGSQTVTQGGGTTYTVTTTALNGFAGTVDLAVTGLPANATATFTPASVNGAGTSTLAVTTAANTPTGTSTVTIMGTSGALTRSASVLLTVTGLTYAISGVISPAADGAGASVNLGGTAVASTTASAGGAFSFAGLANGSYLVTPGKSGFTFTPASRNVSVSSGNVTGVDFTATQSPNTISISAPANGATVSSAFSMSATASASIVAVQFQVDGVNTGPEDTSAPYSVSVTAANGSHTLRAIGRDAGGSTVTSAAVSVTVSGGSGTALAINGSQTFQTMDGMGVNINSLSWKNGQLAPALDRLVDEVGAKTWRVVFDMMDWESTNDNADPNTPNWTYYNALYSNAKFQNLWGTLRHLNQRGVTSGIMISFMGRVPGWMGGPRITNTAAMEDEFVETVSTLLYYARNTENLQFDLLDAINEPDWDGFEGPQVDEWQYPRVLQKLSVKLDALGLGDVRFIGPNTAQVQTGVDRYLPQLLANSVVMGKLAHFGFHNYAGQTGGADARIKGSAYPQKTFWMTELSIPEQIFTMIGQGAAAVQIWDAYDSVYNHAILAGAFYNDGRGSTPPNDAGNLAALMSYNSGSGLYSARPQFYQMATFRYVMPGSVRIGATESNSSLTVYAFRHPATGRVTVVGRNIGGSSITLNGSLSGVGSVGALQFYQTSISNNYNSFTRGADAVVTGGSFLVTVPANSYFTLTSQ